MPIAVTELVMDIEVCVIFTAELRVYSQSLTTGEFLMKYQTQKKQLCFHDNCALTTFQLLGVCANDTDESTGGQCPGTGV